MSLTIQPRVRQAGVSFICHLATIKGHDPVHDFRRCFYYFAHHRACDGKSYTPSILDRGIPCQCTCHPAEGDKP